MQIDIACQWCRGTSFRVTCFPHSVALECRICRAKTFRTHNGWSADNQAGETAKRSGAANAKGDPAVAGNGPITTDLVSPTPKGVTVDGEIVTPKHSLDHLAMTTRSRNCLSKENMKTIGDLLKYSTVNLLCVPHLGKKSVKDIQSELEKIGFELSETGVPFEKLACYDRIKKQQAKLEARSGK